MSPVAVPCAQLPSTEGLSAVALTCVALAAVTATGVLGGGVNPAGPPPPPPPPPHPQRKAKGSAATCRYVVDPFSALNLRSMEVSLRTLYLGRGEGVRFFSSALRQ